MAVCSFSGKTIPAGRGIHLFLRDGTSLWFYDRKCESLYHQKRHPAKLKWTAKGSARKAEGSNRSLKASALAAKTASDVAAKQAAQKIAASKPKVETKPVAKTPEKPPVVKPVATPAKA